MRLKENIMSMFVSLGVIVLLSIGVPGAAGAAAMKGKPMIPVQIAIEATAPHMKPQDIKPGDVVELMVTAPGVRGADETAIEITLQDGAELVSGDLKWSGRLSTKETKRLFISVSAPATGVGKVVARVSALRNGKVVMSKQTVYALGADGISVQGKPAHGMRKDSKGRAVVEY
jgi:hypothetical protein